MFDLPIVDTHVHLWNPENLEYAWLADVPALNHRFELAEFHQHRDVVDVQKMVFVQCEASPHQGIDEARWVQHLSEGESKLQGAVAFAPLEKGAAVREELAALAELPIVKGVRRLLQTEDDAFSVQPKFLEGLCALAEFNFSFDICITHNQMESTIKMVRSCPEVRFVLDHLGKPNIKDGLREPWRTHIQQLADLPNVHCKISGMVTEADVEKWTSDDLRPYVEIAIECFGMKRVMFGGDWPVSTLATNYPAWVETLALLVNGLSDSERQALFASNGAEFYGLG